MISFAALSPELRAAFAFWALALCLTNIGNAVLATVKKRLNFTAFALVLFAPVYFLWQVIFDYSLFKNTDKAAKATAYLCSLPWVYWTFAFILLTAGTVLLLGFNIRYDRTFITPGAIKLYLDKVPCGICCWRENGRVLFSNICMNELCAEITDNPLLNGNQFRDAVKGEIISANGRIRRFVCREISLDGERLYEMIASDITSEYAKTEALEKDKAELSRLNEELREYYLSIDESVSRQEILQAKMNIHDEMNRLMLSTVAADKNDTEALNAIFSLWEQNALLLCLETDKESRKQQDSDIEALASALGLTLIWNSKLPPELKDKQRELFYFAAHEAIINAVKHAQAKEIEVSFERTDGGVLCRFTNDGAMPNGEVKFEGGLANIARLAGNQGAEVYIQQGEKFTLVIKYPPNG